MRTFDGCAPVSVRLERGDPSGSVAETRRTLIAVPAPLANREWSDRSSILPRFGRKNASLAT